MILKSKRLFICILIILLFCGIRADPVAAKSSSYRVLGHDVSVVLTENGQAVITEEIYLETVADLHSYTLNRFLSEDQALTVNSIAVSNTNDKSEATQLIELIPVESTENQLKGMTYQLKKDKQRASIEMMLFLRSGVRRMIQISYTIDRAVQRHVDASVFRQQFFNSEDLADPIDEVSLRVSCTVPYAPEKAWYLASSLTPFTVVETEDPCLYLKAASLSSAHELRFTLVMPKGTFPLASEAVDPKEAETVKENAIRADKQIARRDRVSDMVFSIVFILIGLAAVIFFLLYWFFDREGYWPDKQRYLRDAPHACPPFLLALLLRKFRSAQIILGMLIYFVDQGLLKMEGTVFSKTNQTDRLIDTLSDSEQYLLHWFFDDLAVNGELAIANVRSYARHAETAHEFKERHGVLQRLLHQELAKQGLMDYEKSRKGRIGALVTAGAYGLLAVLLFILLKSPAVWLLLTVTFSLLLYSLTIRRLTNRGRERLMEGSALARYLRRMKYLLPYPDGDRQRAFFPYAVAIGLTGTYLNQLHEIWNEKPIQDQLDVYGISRKNKTTLKKQSDQLVNDLGMIQNILSSSFLLLDMIHRPID